MKLLIVDDDTNLLNLASTYFSGDYIVLQAADGEEALRLAALESPDLIVLDMMLPQLSGEDVLHALQSGKKTKSIPVVVVTAFNYTDEDVKRLESEPDVKALLRKPFGLDALSRKIDSILGRKAASSDR